MAAPIANNTAAGTGTRLSGSTPFRYPSPFFDQASTWFPRTIRELLQYCRLYFWTHPIISATISKLARYPVTDVVVSDDNEGLVGRWRWFLRDHLHIRSFLISSHLDLLVHGNVFISVIYPFSRELICQTSNCDYRIPARNHPDRWDYLGGRFMLKCPKCGNRSAAAVADTPLKGAKGIHLHRWDPMDVIVDDGDYPGTTRYLYRVPRLLRNQIQLGKKHVVAVVPLDFLEAVEQNKYVVLDQDNLRHHKREVISGKFKGWGMPLIAPTLKYAFYLQMMMKAQESVISELLIPLRIVFPQASSGAADPYNNVWLTTWKQKIETEIQRWRMDPMYIPVLPVPVGYQSIGGEGRSLLLSGEIRLLIEQIITSMEVPLEFVFSGTSYSASMVALRQLENLCMSMVEDDRDFLRWLTTRVGAYLQWKPPADISLKPFKTADDLSRRQFYLALAERGKVSAQTLCALNDLDYMQELKLMEEEVKKEVEIQSLRTSLQMDAQAKNMVSQAKAQVKAQAAAAQQAKSEQQGPMMGTTPPGGVGGPQDTEQPYPDLSQAVPGSPMFDNGQNIELNDDGKLEIKGNGTHNVSVLGMARSIASQLKGVDPQERNHYLEQLRTQSPQLHAIVVHVLGGGEIKDLPEQSPPRREAAVL